MTREEMEARRWKAAPLLLDPLSRQQIARLFNVSRTTVSRWRRAVNQGSSLTSRKAPGRPPRIDPARIRSLYLAGPAAAGFEKWTQTKFAQAIEARLGVRYDPDHVGRIIHRLQLKPKRQYKGRDS